MGIFDKIRNLANYIFKPKLREFNQAYLVKAFNDQTVVIINNNSNSQNTIVLERAFAHKSLASNGLNAQLKLTMNKPKQNSGSVLLNIETDEIKTAEVLIYNTTGQLVKTIKMPNTMLVNENKLYIQDTIQISPSNSRRSSTTSSSSTLNLTNPLGEFNTSTVTPSAPPAPDFAPNITIDTNRNNRMSDRELQEYIKTIGQNQEQNINTNPLSTLTSSSIGSSSSKNIKLSNLTIEKIKDDAQTLEITLKSKDTELPIKVSVDKKSTLISVSIDCEKCHTCFMIFSTAFTKQALDGNISTLRITHPNGKTQDLYT
jgi:hypothetical protein